MRALVFVVLAACAPGHINLQDKTYPDVVSQFRALAPAYALRLIALRCSHPTNDCRTTTEARALILGDGRVVLHPDDLIALVDDASETARYARKARKARKRQKQWGLGGLALAIVGGATIYLSRSNDVEGLDGNATGRIAGISMLGTGLLAAALGAWFYNSRAEQHTKGAFKHYGDDLATFLDICVDDNDFVPCRSLMRKPAPAAEDPAPSGPPIPAPAEPPPQ